VAVPRASWGVGELDLGDGSGRGSTAVVVDRWGMVVLDRWWGQGGQRTGRRVLGCSGEAVAGVSGARGWSVRAVDERSSWWMERTAQQRSGALSLCMAARRRDSHSEAMRAHEDSGAEGGRCRQLGGQRCVGVGVAG
jgi:hypothetical protein